MNKKLSVLKLNIILSLFIWVLAGSYSLLNSFDLKGYTFFSLWLLSTIPCAVLLFKRYKPFINASGIDENYITFNDNQIYSSQIVKVYEISPLEKLFFVLKSPSFDYSGTLFENGLVLKAMYDSYLMDNSKALLIECKAKNKP